MDIIEKLMIQKELNDEAKKVNNRLQKLYDRIKNIYDNKELNDKILILKEKIEDVNKQIILRNATPAQSLRIGRSDWINK